MRVVYVTADGGQSVRGLPDTVSLRSRLASTLDGLREATAEETAAAGFPVPGDAPGAV